MKDIIFAGENCKEDIFFMMKKFMNEIWNAEKIIYSTHNNDIRFYCTIDVFDVEEYTDEIIICGDEKSSAEISLSKYPDEILEEDEGWQFKYGINYITITIIE